MESWPDHDVFAGGPGACCPVGVGASGGAPCEWVAICSDSGKVRLFVETLRKSVRRAESDQGLRPGLTSPELERHRAF